MPALLCFALLLISTVVSTVAIGAEQPTPSDTSTDPAELRYTTSRAFSEQDSNGIPANSPAALTIAVGIEFQINSLNSELAQIRQVQSESDAVLAGKADIQHVISDAKATNCSTDAAKLAVDFAIVSKLLGVYYSLSQDIQKTENVSLPQIFGNFWVAQAIDRCTLLRDDSTSEGFANAINSLTELDAKRHRKILELRSGVDSMNSRLRQLLVNQSAISSVTQNLPLILGIIAGAAVVIILVVRCFSPDLQMEWVASGQVIQFTTVMILLSALMALGLTGILREQVLGTLLGGVAGYVLAQGVGRATARATLNAANAANTIPPAAVGAAAGAAAAAILPAAVAVAPRADEVNIQGAGI